MIQGEIQTFPLPDLIQWLALTRRTGSLTFTQGEHRLEFFLAAGEIASASSSERVGPDSPEGARAVLATALSWEWGHFLFRECQLPGEIVATNLRLPAEALLLDVVRQLDELRESHATSAGAEPSEAGVGHETFTPADELRLQVVDRLLRDDFRVPPMPQLAARVLELTRKDFSLRELGSLILTEQAVAARILRYANSALAGSERRVDTLPLAIQRLGADEVINIVLAVSLHAGHTGRDLFAAQRRRLWTHSNATAFFAHSLAARVGLDQNLGFLCGLLLDFGMSVLYSLIRDVLGRGHAPSKVVEEVVQDYHPRVGRVVGERWQLPQAVVESMAYHHCVERATTDRPYVCVSALADFLAAFALGQPRPALEVALSGFPPERLSHHPAGRLIGLDPEKAAAVLRDLPKQLDQSLQFIVD
jgi:HD-like signal output (HDOD) protein